MVMLPTAFFDRNARMLARALVGKVIRRHYEGLWLSARIIETEAYFLSEKGSHASLGYTEKRRGLFMDGGTIYMYYARGGDSLNISAHGPGNAVLIKSGYPWQDALSGDASLALMQRLNPDAAGRARPIGRLCAGQTLLCRALELKVPQWDAQAFDPAVFYVDDAGHAPQQLIQTTRLGIPAGRDEHLPLRYVDPDYAQFCTRNPLRRGQTTPEHYSWVKPVR
jgi:DNA-3-methyladenine glycosylase